MRDGGPPVPYQNLNGIVIDWSPGQDDASKALFDALFEDAGIKKGTAGMLLHVIPNTNIVTDKNTPMTIIVGEKPTW